MSKISGKLSYQAVGAIVLENVGVIAFQTQVAPECTGEIIVRWNQYPDLIKSIKTLRRLVRDNVNITKISTEDWDALKQIDREIL